MISVGLIMVFIFILTVGFKILLNTSLYINQLFNKNSPQVTVEKESFNGDLSIDSIPEATNSAKVLVSGSISNFDSITLYLNKEKIKEIPVASDSFSLEIENLIKGDNTIYFLAKSKKFKETKQSDTYRVTYKDDKPKLEVSEPTDQFKTNKQEIKVSGKTDEDNTVKVNSLPVVVDFQGGFQTTIKLNDGDNKIKITVEDNFGNTESKELTVNYQKDY